MNNFRKTISLVLLPVMMLFTFRLAFADGRIACIPTQVQWYISNGKDVVGTTNDAAEGKQADSYDYPPYGRGTTLSSQAGGRWSVAGRSGQQTVDCRLNALDRHLTSSELQSNSSKIKPCRAEATSVGGNLTQLRQGFRLRKATPGQASGQAFNISNNPFQYSGYYLDVLSGLYYLNARYYSPEFMRFISRDSYDLPNRYAYCNGEPISKVDPTGHNAWLSAMFHNDLRSTLLGIGSLVVGIGVTVVSGGAVAPIGWGIASVAVGSLGQLTDEALLDSRTIKHGSFADKAISWGSAGISLIAAGIGISRTINVEELLDTEEADAARATMGAERRAAQDERAAEARDPNGRRMRLRRYAQRRAAAAQRKGEEEAAEIAVAQQEPAASGNGNLKPKNVRFNEEQDYGMYFWKVQPDERPEIWYTAAEEKNMGRVARSRGIRLGMDADEIMSIDERCDAMLANMGLR